MRGILAIAAVEILEHRRQPWMLFILAFNYALWIGIFGLLFVALETIQSQPETASLMRQNLESFGVALEAFIGLSTSAFGSLMFTNLPLFVAIMAGYSVLHDRATGTMPFLMLAPLTRRRLIAGKLLGVMALPLLLHALFVGLGCLLLGRLEVLSGYRDRLGGSPAFWVAFLLGAPAAAAFVGALGTVISALSKDVRTSMQFTSFTIGLLSLGIGLTLVDGIPAGVGLQLAFAAGCTVAAGLTLLLGAHLISRDIGGS